MTNINKLTVESILTANNKGIGKTDSLPALYSLEGNTFEIKGIAKAVVSEQLIGAKFIQLFHSFIKDMEPAKKVQHVDALSKGYLTLDQLRATSTDVKARPKANITAAEYKANCIKLALDSPEVLNILTYFVDLDADKVTKNNLVVELINLKAALFNDNQQGVYQVKVDKELAEKERFNGLIANGFTITDSSEKDVTVVTSLTNMGSVHLLAGLGYNLKASSIDVTTGTALLTLVVAPVPELV